MTSTNELRVFVSSTFRDLQEEREHLVKKVFPEIRAMCRERGITFTEIDLRWGITDTDAVNGRVIGTCLDEVNRCQPYFIGVLGSRYGWVPSSADIAADASLLMRYPWLVDAVREGMSLTEMEFMEGALRHDRATRCALFYRRVGPCEPGIQRLAERTRACGYELQEFRDAVALGAMVHSDLAALIERVSPSNATATPLQRERSAHASFAASRLRGYVERPELTRTAVQSGRGSDAHLSIVAEPGLGKSSLVASIAEKLRRDDPLCAVVEHYVGATDSSALVDGMLRHVLEALRREFEIGDPLPSGAQELEMALQSWLFRIDHVAHQCRRRVVLLIDGLDGLEARGHTMAWLPERLPGWMRIVLTCRPGPIADALAARGVRRMEIAPIDSTATREAIVARYLAGYHKRIAAPALAELAACPGASSPLFLRVAAEELRLHGEHESIIEVVHRCAGAASVGELFTLVLARMEHDFGREPVESVFGLILASRDGLTEHELLELSGLTRVELSRLLYSLEYHLIRREAHLGFFHDHLRLAVENRYHGSGVSLADRHRQIARYFASQPVSARRCAEEPYQWFRAGEHRRLADALTEPELFMRLNDARTRHELVGYWRALESSFDPVEEYSVAISRVRRGGWTALERAGMMEQVAELHTARASYPPAEDLLRAVRRYYHVTCGADAPATVRVTDHLATTVFHAGRYEECESLWTTALESARRVYGAGTAALCSILDSLAAVAYHRSDLRSMTQHAEESLAISTRLYGSGHPESIERLLNAGAVRVAANELEDGIDYYRTAVAAALREYGAYHPLTARCQSDLAFALQSAGRVQESIAQLRETATVTEEMLGEHTDLARVLEVLGTSLVMDDNPDEAESIFRRAYAIRLRHQGERHPRTMYALARIALAVRRCGRPVEAEAIARALLPLQIEVCGEHDPDVKATMLVLINALRATGRDDEAAEWQQRYDATDG